MFHICLIFERLAAISRLLRWAEDWLGGDRTFFGVVAEVGEAGVDASPGADDAVRVVGVCRRARRPRPFHTGADVVVLAARIHTNTHIIYMYTCNQDHTVQLLSQK